MDKTALLKKALISSDKMNLNNIKKTCYYCDNYAVLSDLLIIIDDELSTIDRRSKRGHYIYLNKAISLILIIVRNLKLDMEDIAYSKLNELSNKMIYIIQNKDIDNKLVDLISNMYIDIENIKCNLKKTSHKNKEKEELLKDIDKDNTSISIDDNKTLVYYLLFNYKNINVCKEIISKQPLFSDVINNNIIDIMHKVIYNYTIALLHNDSDSNYYYLLFVYLTSIKEYKVINNKQAITDIISSTLDTIEESDKTANKLNLVIDNLNDLLHIIDAEISDRYDIADYSNKVDLHNHLIHHKKELDLTSKYAFTIDGKATQCMDDAISFDKLPSGNYELGIYIADLTNIVLPNTNIDINANILGATIYNRNNPLVLMLPKVISEVYSSLNTTSNKHVHAYMFEIDRNFNIISFTANNAIINVKHRYTYEEIDNLIKTSTDKFADKLRVISNFADYLNNNDEIRKEYIKTKEQLKPEKKMIDYYNNNHGTLIVEQLKVLTNSLLASIVFDSNIPFIYRVNICRNINVPSDISKILKSNTLYNDVSSALYSKFGESFYSSINLGHCGMNAKAYAHVTTPLRNYAALFNQRIVQKAIIDGDLTNQEYYKLEKVTPLLADYLNMRMILNNLYCDEVAKEKELIKILN